MKALIIGGVSIPDLAALELQQTYEPIGGELMLRTIGGSAIEANHLAKVAYDDHRRRMASVWPVVARLLCADESNGVASCRAAVVCSGLPARFRRRRSDTGYVPWGVALMADQTTQVTAATMW